MMVNVVHKFEYMTICHFHSYVQLTAFTWIQANSKLYSLLVDKQRPGSAGTAKLDQETMVDVGDLRFAHTFFNNRRIGVFNIWGMGLSIPIRVYSLTFLYFPLNHRCTHEKKEHDWLVVWLPFFIFPSLGLLIIPIDELLFFRGVAQPPTRSTSRWDFHLWLGQMIPLIFRYPGIVSFGTCLCTSKNLHVTTHARPHKSLLVWLLHVFTASKHFIQI